MDERTEGRRVAVVGAARVGVRDRLAALYDDNVRWATRLAYLITQDADLAQDVTQDAFVKVFARFKERVPPAEFTAYLRRTIVNLCNDVWRRKRIERRHQHVSESDIAKPPRDLDALQDLVSALRQLPVRQRTVLVLKHFEDMSEVGIADALGCSVGAVKGLTTRGLNGLREAMGGSYE